MPILVILKRFEIWMLFAVVVGLIVFAFKFEPETPVPSREPEAGAAPKGASEKNPEQEEAFAPQAGKRLVVQDVTITDTSGGKIVETTLAGRASGASDLVLDETNVSATTGEGEVVARFFEPFVDPPVLLASEDSLAVLRWWIESPVESLWLELQGEKVLVDLP